MSVELWWRREVHMASVVEVWVGCHVTMPQMRLSDMHWYLEVFLEPVGVCREDAKRPDGMMLIPWESEQSLLWDFTCSDLAPSNQALASRSPAEVACAAED